MACGFGEVGATNAQFGAVTFDDTVMTPPVPTATMHATLLNVSMSARARAFIVTVGRKALASAVLCCKVSVTWQLVPEQSEASTELAAAPLSWASRVAQFWAVGAVCPCNSS